MATDAGWRNESRIREPEEMALITRVAMIALRAAMERRSPSSAKRRGAMPVATIKIAATIEPGSEPKARLSDFP